MDPKPDAFRDVGPKAWAHYTITGRNEPQFCQNPHASRPIETDVFERSRDSLPV
jgi:hypothetical protein